MPRTAIAAVLAMLLLAAPAASARPVDTPKVNVVPERITDTGAAAQPKVMPERITDHGAGVQTSSLAGTTNETTAALAGNHGVQPAADRGVPPADDDNSPWVLVALGSAAAVLVAGMVTAAARARTRVTA